MSRIANNSLGAQLAERFYKARKRAGGLSLGSARNLPVIRGLTPAGLAVGTSLDSLLATAQDLLTSSRKIFGFGNAVMMEIGEGTDGRLIPLVVGHRLESVAESLLANFFVCEGPGREDQPGPQFAAPRRFVAQLLNRLPTRDSLPCIRTYARRPTFDDEFVLCGPGWHASSGILVHGPDIEPILPPRVTADRPLADRLPPHVRALFRDFCFRSDADAVNALAALLTGMLARHFVEPGKPVLLLDGTQPGLGKTLFARVVGRILDGTDPHPVHYTLSDEELAKRICATLLGNPQSIALIDNAKTQSGTAISSPAIEANCMAPVVSLRILGKSQNYTRPNDLLWALTMNATKASEDIVSRGLPIRFHFDGNPAQRNFSGRDPVAYARECRTEILGELAGLVVAWNQRGRPMGTVPHRCAHWAAILGGVLTSNGLPEFLMNLNDAASEFSVELDELTALAEAALRLDDARYVVRDAGDGIGADDHSAGLPAAEWEQLFRQAGLLGPKLDEARSARAKSTLIGAFLARHIGREVEVLHGGVVQRYALRMHQDRSNSKLYILELIPEQRRNSGGGPLRPGGPRSPRSTTKVHHR